MPWWVYTTLCLCQHSSTETLHQCHHLCNKENITLTFSAIKTLDRDPTHINNINNNNVIAYMYIYLLFMQGSCYVCCHGDRRRMSLVSQLNQKGVQHIIIDSSTEVLHTFHKTMKVPRLYKEIHVWCCTCTCGVYYPCMYNVDATIVLT